MNTSLTNRFKYNRFKALSWSLLYIIVIAFLSVPIYIDLILANSDIHYGYKIISAIFTLIIVFLFYGELKNFLKGAQYIVEIDFDKIKIFDGYGEKTYNFDQIEELNLSYEKEGRHLRKKIEILNKNSSRYEIILDHSRFGKVEKIYQILKERMLIHRASFSKKISLDINELKKFPDKYEYLSEVIENFNFKLISLENYESKKNSYFHINFDIDYQNESFSFDISWKTQLNYGMISYGTIYHLNQSLSLQVENSGTWHFRKNKGQIEFEGGTHEAEHLKSINTEKYFWFNFYLKDNSLTLVDTYYDEIMANSFSPSINQLSQAHPIFGTSIQKQKIDSKQLKNYLDLMIKIKEDLS